MAIYTYTLDPVGGVNDEFTRTTLAGIETHYSGLDGKGSPNLTTNGDTVIIRQVSNLSVGSYNFGGWTTSADYRIQYYGWDSVNSVYDRDITITCNSAYSDTMIYNYNRHVDFSYLTFNANSQADTNALSVSDNGTAKYCICKGGTSSGRFGLATAGTGYASACLATGNYIGLRCNNYYTSTFINCTSVKNNAYGIYGDDNGQAKYIYNCVVYGNTTQNWACNFNAGSASYNAGASGDSIAYSGTDTRITITSSDFTDYTNNDFSITSTSKLRHTHADYPSGNNQHTTYLTLDYFGDTLPSTYSTDDDQWDTGFDYFVVPITGTIWRVRDSEISGGVVTLTNSTAIEEATDANNTSTLGAVSSGSDKDMLKIINGVTATLSGTTVTFSKRGLAVDIADGELVLRNTSSTVGMQWWGWQTKLITVGPLGKLTIDCDLINLCTVTNLNASAWTTFWSTDTDTNTEYAEPAVIFIGTSPATALPYLNKGTISTTVENNDVHGRLFAFNVTTGAITFPDNTPTGSDNVYIYNFMIHSKDGQGTNANSFGFATTDGGSVDILNCYHTGAVTFAGAALLTLNGFGILQQLNIDDCQNVNLNTYRGVSSTNAIDDAATFKNLTAETIGSYYSAGMQTNLSLYSIINSSFTSLTCYLYATQTASNYPVVIGSSSGGTDGLTITTLNLRGGGVQFTTAQSNDTTITAITHSNDCTGNNTSNSQHIILVGSSGTRRLNIDAISLVTGGDPCNLDIVNISNSGNFVIKNITYNGSIRNIGYFTNCFSGMFSGFVVGQISGQPFKFKTNCKDITVQNGYSTSTGTVAAFDYYSMRDICFKNVPYQDTEEYLLADWTTGAMPDVNFMELNKYGTPYTGVLVQNFYRSSKGEFTFAGSAKSNKDDAVLLPAVDDAATVTSPYQIKVGDSTSYFQNSAPVLVGTGTGNFTVEYRLNVNGAGYGSWTTLNATNLSAESFTANDEFLIQIRVTCDTAGTTNEIRQIVIYTAPDETITYPIDSYTLTLDSQNGDDLEGAQISLYDNDSATPGDMGTELAESNNNATSTFTYVHYGVTNSIYIQAIKPGYVEQVIPFTLIDENQTVYINLALDENE